MESLGAFDDFDFGDLDILLSSVFQYVVKGYLIAYLEVFVVLGDRG